MHIRKVMSVVGLDHTCLVHCTPYLHYSQLVLTGYLCFYNVDYLTDMLLVGADMPGLSIGLYQGQ